MFLYLFSLFYVGFVCFFFYFFSFDTIPFRENRVTIVSIVYAATCIIQQWQEVNEIYTNTRILSSITFYINIEHIWERVALKKMTMTLYVFVCVNKTTIEKRKKNLTFIIIVFFVFHIILLVKLIFSSLPRQMNAVNLFKKNLQHT